MTRSRAALARRPLATPLAAAVDWMVLLQSGDASPADAARHRAWCEADPAHAGAWAQVSAALDCSVQPLRDSALPRTALQAALTRPTRVQRPTRRRLARNALVVGGLAALVGWQTRHPWPDLMSRLRPADFETGTGERQTVTLDDGSLIQLNARSAVDIRFDRATRALQLRSGEIIVSVAPEANRPFIVRTVEGSIQALGTRFLVRQAEARTVVLVLEHSVEVRNRTGARRLVREGEALGFAGDHFDQIRTDRGGQAGWQDGMLVAANEPLGEVIEALRPYHRGLIRLSPAAASLRVLGAFPIDDPGRVLESLAQTLPLKVTDYGGWLVLIDRRDGAAAPR